MNKQREHKALIFYLDHDGKVIRMNSFAEVLWPKAKGKSFLQKIANGDRHIKKGFERVIKTGKVWQGMFFPFADRGIDVFIMPEEDGTIRAEMTEQGYVRPSDITSIHGPLPYLVQEKIKFLLKTSHALRTPLTIIKSGLDFLSDEKLSPENHKLVLSLSSEANKFSRILEKILWISRIDIGVPISPEKINLKDFLEAFLEGFATSYNRKVETDFPKKDIYLRTEKSSLSEILGNLLENAFKFCPKGQVKIQIKDEENQVKIIVKDNGVGISKEHEKRIFDRFYTSKESGNEKGTGLGLAIVKELVDLQGGQVGFCKPKKGAEVFFTLPKAK